MKDTSRTKQQLIKEIAALRRRVGRLERKQDKWKEMEEELKRTARERSIFLDAVSEFVIYQDAGMRILWANRAALDCAEMGVDDLRGRYCFEVWHNRKEPCDRCPVVKACKTGEPQEADIEAPSGRTWNIIAYPVKNADGEVTAVTEIAKEVTESRRALEALRESEELYRTLVRTSPDSITVTDLEGRITHISRRALDIHGTGDPGDLIGKNSLELIVPEDRERAMVNLQRTLEKGIMESTEYVLLRKDGSRYIGELNASLVRDAKGNPKAFIAAVRDITERKRVQEALAEEKELLAVTLRSIGDGVITTDTKGRVMLMNRAAETLTGFSQEEGEGRSLREIFRVIDEKTREPAANPVDGVLESGGGLTIPDRTVLVAKDEKEWIIADSGAPIRNSKGRIIGVVIVFRDITEKHKMEEELQRAQKLESVGVLAGGLAHDFNNIMTAVIGNISLAKLLAGPEDEIFSRLDDAGKAASIAKDLTRQLLTFSKGGAPVKKVTSIKELLTDTTEFALSGSNVKSRFDMQEDMWSLECDVSQICQVFNNLVINAKQAMPEGGTIGLTARNVTVGVKDRLPLKEGKYVKISVEDQGVGIPKEHLPCIFDPYFTTKQRGSGLGLATTYAIINKHNGYINVNSEVGAGTTFEIYLPATGKRSTVVRRAGRRAQRGKGKILLMDDEEIIRKVAGTLLRHLGYDVEFALEGSEMVEKYKDARKSGAPFDAVIMDLTIPGGLGGKDAIKRILEIDPRVKAIVSSGYFNDTIMSNYRKYGFKGVVAKPYEIDELSETLQKILDDE